MTFIELLLVFGLFIPSYTLAYIVARSLGVLVVAGCTVSTFSLVFLLVDHLSHNELREMWHNEGLGTLARYVPFLGVLSLGSVVAHCVAVKEGFGIGVLSGCFTIGFLVAISPILVLIFQEENEKE